MKINTSYLEDPIRRIHELQYAVFNVYYTPRFWKISNVVLTPRNPQYAVSHMDGYGVPIPVTAPESGPSTALNMTVPSTAEEMICKKNDVKYVDAPINVLLLLSSLWRGYETHMKGPQKSLLKQQYENFNASTSESLDYIFNRLQKLVSRLAILGVVTPPKDLNVKFLRSLPSEWDTHVVKESAVYAFLSTQPQGSQLVHEDLEQLHDDDLEEMDLKWNMSLLSMRARKFYHRTGRKIIIDGSNTAGFDKSKLIKGVRLKMLIDKGAMCAIDGAGFDWSDMAEEEIQVNMALMAFSDSEVTNDKSCSKSCLKNYEALKKQYDDLLVKLDDTGFKLYLQKRSVGHKNSIGLHRMNLKKIRKKRRSKGVFGYNVVPSPHPLILNRPTPLDLSYSGLEEFKRPEVNEYGPRDSSLKPTTGCDKESDNSKENTDDSLKQQQKTDSKTSFVKSSLKVDKIGKKSFFVLQIMLGKDILRKCPKLMVPRAVLMKTGLKTINNAMPVNTVRSINTGRPFSTARSFNTVRPSYTAHPKSTSNCARPKTYLQNQAQSTVHRPFYKRTALTKRSYNQNVNTGRQNVNTGRQNVNTVRARGFNSNSQLNDKGFVDSGCSRHMSGNIAHLSDFKDFDGGYVLSVADAQIQDQNGLHDEIDDSEKTHDDSSLQNNGTADQQVNTARPEVNTGSREVSTVVPEVNTATPEDLKKPRKSVSKALSAPVMGRSNAGGTLNSSNCKVKDKRGIVIRNKARLVAQGHTQKEGIDYDEVFALVARIEAIRIFLAYASLWVFWSTQWDVNSALPVWSVERRYLYVNIKALSHDHPNMSISCECLYGTPSITKSLVLTLWPLIFEQWDFKKGQIDQPCPTEKKAFLSVKILCHEILESFNYTDVKSATTPTDLEKPLVQDVDDVDVDDIFIDYERIFDVPSKHPDQEMHLLTLTVDYAGAKLIGSQPLEVVSFWENRSAEVTTDDNGEVKINATIDGHSLSITEGSLRRRLKLADQDGITSIPNSEIFEQLALMGYHTDSDKLTFQKGAFSPQWRFSYYISLHCLLATKKICLEQFSSNIATAVICLATNRKFNFRMIFEHMVSNISSPHKFLMYPRFFNCHRYAEETTSTTSRTYHVPSLSNKVFNNMKRPTKGYSGQEVALFPTMLDVTEPSTSPSRITSSPSPSPDPSPSHSPEPSTQHSPDNTTAAASQPSPTQPSLTHPSPGAEHHFPTPHDSPLHAVQSHGSDEGSLKLKNLMNLGQKLESQLKMGKQGRKLGCLSDDEVIEDDSSKQEQGNSEKGSAEVSTTGAIKDTTSEEVLIVSTAKVNLSTTGGTVTLQRSEEKRKEKTRKSHNDRVEPMEKSKKEVEQERISFTESHQTDFNQHIEPMDSEHRSEKMKSPEKMKSAEKMEEEDVATQKEMKERQKMEEDAEKEELKGFLDIIPREEVPIEVESLSTKFPIVDWKTCVLTENFMYYQVFRGDGSSKNYKVLTEMLEDFDRQDVEELYRLVKERSSKKCLKDSSAKEKTRRFYFRRNLMIENKQCLGEDVRNKSS
ncbi:putative ribonuclease H-like domain-containing protein [Tanacetum coccineum]